MLLLHTILAVVCGGLLVSARPEPVQGRRWDAEDTEFTDANVPSYHVQHGAPTDDAWEWAPQGPQHIFGTPPHHTEGFPLPNTDRDNWPKPPHSFPDPPQNDPERPQLPPQFPPEPHYPPPSGPPPPHPPKEGPPHGPHPPDPHHPHPPHPPHFPHPDPGTKDQTVYQFLESHSRFSRLFKLVNYTEDVTSYLNDSSQSVTLFALPDFGFPKPPHHPDHNEVPELEDLFQMPEGSLGDMLTAAEGYLNRAHKPDEGKIKAFIKYVLLYNILPENTPLHELGKNNTFATALKLSDGSLDGKPLRVRVKRNIGLDPRPYVNFVSKVLVPDIPVKNGIIHVVSKPILPPPSIFQIGFLFSDAFSTFTSALQRVGLTDELDFSNTEDGSTQGSPAVSVFAPTNKAFSRLPPKLKLFLFSPFGKKALKKLLQFHIVPEAVLHSDYFHNASQSEFTSPQDNSETGEFYAQLDQYPEVWSPIFEDPSYVDWRRLDDEDAYESSEWREAKFNSGKVPSWENDRPRGHGPSFPQHGPPFPGDGPRDGPHFPYPGGAHPPQHHGPFPPPPPSPPHDGPHHPSPLPPPPPPPEVWLHYPPPPPPPHHLHGGPHHPPHYPAPPPPPDVWVHYPPPPPPPRDPHHSPHFPPPPPPFEDRPHQPPHHPPPPPPPHGPHGLPHFPPPPPGKLPKEGRPHHRPEVVYSVNATVPTLLENYPLDVKIVQLAFKGPHDKPSFYHTFVVAHGQHVAVADIAARNGAFHVITKLLNPLKKPGHHHGHDEEHDEPTFRPFAEEEEDEWAGWEEWLPLWAEEQD